MERKTVEITSEQGTKAIVKEYLTAREMRAINVKLVGEKAMSTDEKPQIPLASALEWETEVLKASVESVNGVTENPVEILLDLSDEEYKDLKEKIYTQLKVNLKPTK